MVDKAVDMQTAKPGVEFSRMISVRAGAEEVRRFILEHVADHPNDIAKEVATRFDMTRQAASKHLQKLVDEGLLSESGNTRARSYVLTQLEWYQEYPITPDLAEDVIWTRDISRELGKQAENALDIWHFGFTEMFNNAIDHSGGTEILVGVTRTAVSTEMVVGDNGVGIFKKIQKALNLLDETHAVLELSKGKLTTDPQRHSGEGIFFTSRMFDAFDIISGDVSLLHRSSKAEDWIMEEKHDGLGTAVWMNLDNKTTRTRSRIYEQYSADGDLGFTKTVVPVKLAQYGTDQLISRSQAKRLLARIDRFKKVVLDFTEVPTIGQAFADEIFRVFANQHPAIQLFPIRTSPDVKKMIERVKASNTT